MNPATVRSGQPAFGRFNPFLPEHRNDPHATWRTLREEVPVYRSRVFGAFLCTRYDDVLRILRDPIFTTDRSGTAGMRAVMRVAKGHPDFAGLIERNLLTLDGPEHRRLRKLVSKAFTPRRIEQLRPGLEATVDDLLERVAEEGEMEVVSSLAYPLPVIAIADLLGVPQQDHDRFRDWAGRLVQLLDPFQGRGGAKPMIEATSEIFDYFRGLLADRRANPRDDLLSAMLAAEEDGERLAEVDLLSLSSLLLVAGHETTSNLIGSSVHLLLRFPDERKRLQDDLGLLSTAVDEFLRFESPIQFTDRAVLEDCEIGGQAIRKGQLVVAGLQAANRDPAHFADPDRLDVGRTDNPHLAFSQGAHFCLGSQLAKLEAEVAIGALLRRFPDFSGPPQPSAWRRSMIVRGPESLNVKLA
ncbi:MAG: cytochrome P450 [Deltaproteobacteria bacterium]|nr:cytochrome P450 [Deltaproteobacteria bacterium]